MELAEYRKVNASYKRSLVFHFGAFAGFYSEYNNMLRAMAFCLVNKIRFKLYSSDSPLCLGNGWNDFFIPFVDREENNEIHHTMNTRFPEDNRQTIFLGKAIIQHVEKLFGLRKDARNFNCYEVFFRDRKLKRCNNFNFFTKDLWNDFAWINMEEVVHVKNMFTGTYFSLIKDLDHMIWHYNDHTREKVLSAMNSLDVPSMFAGLHVRAGDKITESAVYSGCVYMDRLLDIVPEVKDVFVFTDDYRIVQNLRAQYQGVNFYTLCSSSELGYNYGELLNGNEEVRVDQTIRMFASVDLLKQASVFVGTKSSNPFWPVYFSKNKENCFSID